MTFANTLRELGGYPWLVQHADPDEFVHVVEERFGALRDRGFQLAPNLGGDTVRYESSTVSVMIYKLELEHSASLRIGLLDQPRDAITDAELVALAGVAANRSHVSWRDAVAELAAELFMYGERALAGDPAEFLRAKELRRRYTEQFT